MKLKISDQAKALASAGSTSATDDSAKIDRLKSAISDGSFKVDSGKIANKIVDGE